MPALPVKSYLTKANAFIGHWTSVNAMLTPDLVVSYNLANFIADKDFLGTLIDDIEAARNVREVAIGTRDNLRAGMRERMRQFYGLVRGVLEGHPLERTARALPNLTDGPTVWRSAMADVHSAWTQINALTPPLPSGLVLPMLLQGGYTLANFTTDQAALNTAFDNIPISENGLTTAIENRDRTWGDLYAAMRQYRQAVQGRFTSIDPLYLSLPSLTPPAGSTPDAVDISAVWDVPLAKAVITYTASTRTDLQEYELRASFGGTKYSDDNASVIDNHPAGNLTPFQTNAGLVASGSKVYYKVYVITNTGNEKGSRTASVTRP